MKKDVAMKWVKALRSGKYKQAKESLQNQNENGYCCLGVLCKIAEKENIPIRYDEQSIYRLFGETLFHQFAVQQWSELKSTEGNFNKHRSLVYLNDNGKSFKYIANVIEKHWRKL